MCLLDVCCLAKWKIEKVTRPTFKGGEIANKTAEKDKIGKKVETNTDIKKRKWRQIQIQYNIDTNANVEVERVAGRYLR